MIIAMDKKDLSELRTYTVEEMDEQLSILVNIRKSAKRPDLVNIEKQINTWLDRRIKMQAEAGGK